MSSYVITFEWYPGTEIKVSTAVCIATGKDDAVKRLKKKIYSIYGNITVLDIKHIGEEDVIIGKSIQELKNIKKKNSEKSF